MFPSNLSQLKKFLKENQHEIKLTLIEFNLNGNDQAEHKFLNCPRRLTTVNSAGFGLTYSNRESFCDWPKATELKLDEIKKQIEISFEPNMKLIYQVEDTAYIPMSNEAS